MRSEDEYHRLDTEKRVRFTCVECGTRLVEGERYLCRDCEDEYDRIDEEIEQYENARRAEWVKYHD